MKIGTDIIQISRIEKMIDKYGDTFKQKYLTPSEIIMAKKISTLAGLWAAKESISKALGCGICTNLTFQDIIISKNSKGAPNFTLSDKSKKIYPIKNASLSISHDGGFAIAVVIIELVKSK